MFAEALAMLERHEKSAGFLETPALEVEARALARDIERHGPKILELSQDAPGTRPALQAPRERRVPWWMWLLTGVFACDCLL